MSVVGGGRWAVRRVVMWVVLWAVWCGVGTSGTHRIRADRFYRFELRLKQVTRTAPPESSILARVGGMGRWQG